MKIELFCKGNAELTILSTHLSRAKYNEQLFYDHFFKILMLRIPLQRKPEESIIITDFKEFLS